MKELTESEAALLIREARAIAELCANWFNDIRIPSDNHGLMKGTAVILIQLAEALAWQASRVQPVEGGLAERLESAIGYLDDADVYGLVKEVAALEAELALVKKERDLVWTTEVPTVEGWYWVLAAGGKPVVKHIARRHHGLVAVSRGRDCRLDNFGHFAGPIPTPKEVQP